MCRPNLNVLRKHGLPSESSEALKGKGGGGVWLLQHLWLQRIFVLNFTIPFGEEEGTNQSRELGTIPTIHGKIDKQPFRRNKF